MFFKSLKREMLFFTLGLTALTIFLTTALNVNSTKVAGQNAENATSDVLRQQVKEFLVQLAGASAQNQDLVFDQIKNIGAGLASYTKNIYENPLIFSNDYWQFDSRVFKKGGKYLNSKSDASTIHIPNFVTLDAEEKKKVELTANLYRQIYLTTDDFDNPWEIGVYDLEIPDTSHRGGINYPNVKYAKVWFRIGHGGERFLHTGRYSRGCITVVEQGKWDELCAILLKSRKGDGRSVGILEVVV